MDVGFWDNRYKADHYVYGTDPNAFFKENLDKLTTGKILFPFEGEGRNAVYAAIMGWEVTAFDQSAEGMKKAHNLAGLNNVSINYMLGDWQSIGLENNHFDTAALIFAHPSPEVRTQFHRFVVSKLKPGGTLILEAYTKEQLKYNTGGPKDERMLFSAEEIESDFSEIKIISLEEKIVELKEGDYHDGESSIIRVIAQK